MHRSQMVLESESTVAEITGVHEIFRRQEKALDALIEGVDLKRVTVSQTAAKLFVRYFVGHRAGLKNYLDDKAQANIADRDRRRMKKKTFAQARELEDLALRGWIRSLLKLATDTGQRTRKRGYRVLRLQCGSGPVYKITYNETDAIIIGFYTGDWFDRSCRKPRLAHRRRHSRS